MKQSTHAPFRKRILIPLWTFQLGLTLYQIGWSLLIFVDGIQEQYYEFPSHDKAGIAIAFITALLSLGVLALILLPIIQFARLRLSTLAFLKETVAAFAILALCLILDLAIRIWWASIFIAANLVVSAGLAGYSWGVRRKVGKGMRGEMVRVTGRGGIGFELEREEERVVDSVTGAEVGK